MAPTSHNSMHGRSGKFRQPSPTGIPIGAFATTPFARVRRLGNAVGRCVCLLRGAAEAFARVDNLCDASYQDVLGYRGRYHRPGRLGCLGRPNGFGGAWAKPQSEDG